jgi:DNA-binding CsgD family transcriptional regulator
MSPECFIGRASELARLESLLAGVAAGVGGAVLVEGEQGIGKTALLRQALGGAGGLGCALAWGAADELGQRFPLWLMTECLGTRGRLVAIDGGRGGTARRTVKGNGRRETAMRLADSPVPLAGLAGPVSPDDPEAAGVERLLTRVERRCAASPVVLVAEDLQWADEASLRVWQRLARAVDQVPLLLVGSLRPGPMGDELDRLRRGLKSRGGTVLSLGPLAPPDVLELASRLAGRLPERQLHGLVRCAGGNPLYARELVKSFPPDRRAVPASLAGAIERRLSALPPELVGVLRWAAVLGSEFTVTDLAVVTGRTAGELIGVVGEAVTAALIEEAVGSAVAGDGAVTGMGPRLAFRHGLVRQVLYADMPAALRAALHLQAARALACAGAAPERVAAQLAVVPDPADEWVLDWLADATPALTYRAPKVAADVLRGVLKQVPDADERREALEAGLVIAAFLLGRNDEVERAGGRLLAYARDPARAAEAAWRVSYALMRTGRPSAAVSAAEKALRRPGISVVWTARLHALRALTMCAAGQPDPADAARKALALGEEADDRFAGGYALYALSQADFRRCRYVAALDHIEEALDLIGDDPQTTDLRLLLLSDQAHALDQLDRPLEAVTAIRAGLELAERAGTSGTATVGGIAAEHYFSLGQWDDALAAVEQAVSLPDSGPGAVHARGLGALIAAHRDDWETAAGHLAAVPDEAAGPAFHRANQYFLLLARALTAEQAGRQGEAVAVLSAGLDPALDGNLICRFLAFPALMRLALAIDDAACAAAAAAAAAQQAERESLPVKTAAAQACLGLLDGDPGPLLAAAAYYESSGRPLERAQVLEDAAVLLAGRGDLRPARQALSEAVGLYRDLGARWDVRRATNRLRDYGIRPASRGRRPAQPATGWQSLTPTETKIAYLIARGQSNPDIAAELWLSRNTVQTHVSHILAKLSVRSRVEVAGEALRQQPAPEQPQDRLTA